MDRADALRKFQALRKMTVARGATPGEAATAKGLADRLASRFGFSEADADSRNAFDFMREAMQHQRDAMAREHAARAAREAAAREAARAAREAAARQRHPGAGAQARDDAHERDRQWWYDYNAARRTWHWEHRKCGDQNCWCSTAPKGYGHGPYRYSKQRRGRKVNSVYLGRPGRA